MASHERAAAENVTRAVLVTRPPPGGARLAALLEAHGLCPELLPVLEIGPPDDPAPLLEAARQAAAGRYDWIVLSSANAVRALVAALTGDSGRDGAPPAAPIEGAVAPVPGPPARIAAVGAATAAAIRREGWRVDLVPDRYTAEGLVDAFTGEPLRGRRILFPAAEAARDTLPRRLQALGATVDRVVAYASRPLGDTERLRVLLGSGRLALLTVASPSAAEALLELAGEEALRIPAAAVGPVTAEAARVLGFNVVAVAEPHTSEGLAEAAARWLNRPAPSP